jgi:hypothetical protein
MFSLLIALHVSEDGRTSAAVSAAIWEIENRFRNTTRAGRNMMLPVKRRAILALRVDNRIPNATKPWANQGWMG